MDGGQAKGWDSVGWYSGAGEKMVTQWGGTQLPGRLCNLGLCKNSNTPLVNRYCWAETANFFEMKNEMQLKIPRR